MNPKDLSEKRTKQKPPLPSVQSSKAAAIAENYFEFVQGENTGQRKYMTQPRAEKIKASQSRRSIEKKRMSADH